MKLRVLVVNLDNIVYTRNCINNLLQQDHTNFNITVVDQNSKELGTTEYFDKLKKDNRLDVVINEINEPLNSVWNWFHNTYKEDLLCFLNNDVIIPRNFIGDTVEAFSSNDEIVLLVTQQITQNMIQLKII